ncbi:MAG: Kae1-like domain-containing protein [Symbiobacteriia bacterium]
MTLRSLSPNDWVLGLDTSFYTTSVAAVSLGGELLAEQRSLLPVPAGARGLRPQEGVFLHVRALPELFQAVLAETRRVRSAGRPVAVAASVRPLPQPDSYLPVFRVSEGFGLTTAAAWDVPFVAATHQEGHLLAGAWSAGLSLADGSFIAAHLSGGTTDILDVEPQPDGRLRITRLGTGKDLHVGQFIDRVGVALGLPFPAGPALERLAAAGQAGPALIPSRADSADLSFSGPETAALRLIARGAHPADVAYGVQACVARGVEKALNWALRQTGRKTVLVVGGVAANSFLRAALTSRLAAQVHFAAPQYSTDNAVGVAFLGRAAALVAQN